ncbi:MAG: bifunctional phosphopantothenoylcysteine decarboxylase/phosphopantothenate--cysteine ligase CoaBC [Chitinophagaceae bacterium]|nr:bifunctional phosphopantothenoylcysteine decarboxylase/phosphopantothenate--cysteine ligase CoaBC [Chitinophagaceae bacterium]
MNLSGKKILLGITGSIAAYKAIYLVRLLVKAGAEVKVVMTPASRDFVSPLTLSTLSHHPVHIDLFQENEWANHVQLGRWADVMVIAPLSVNTLSKMAQGQCDNLLLATWLSATCPVVLAPAMDEDMWHHPFTQENLQKLISIGHKVIPVEKGELASGLVGEGRMAEPETIFSFIQEHFFFREELKGRKAIVTAGPTYESLDPVRFIGNHSSGKMGVEIAKALYARGADVTLVLGPSAQPSPSGIETIRVQSAQQMFEAVSDRFDQTDIAVMSAAVADYTPVNTATEKIKKTGDRLVLELQKTPDILRTMGERKKNQVLIGFALETTNEKEYALEKLRSKNADMIVLNSLRDEGAGFGKDTNKVTLFDKSGKEFDLALQSKQQVAHHIVDTLISIYYA